MSKLVKKMQMDSLSQSLGETRDMVLLNMSGVPAKEENTMRLALRKKNVRLQLVKNALARRVLKEQKFLAGACAAYPDYALAGSFLWAHIASPLVLLEGDDPLYAWRERMLDLFDGMGREAKGRKLPSCQSATTRSPCRR